MRRKHLFLWHRWLGIGSGILFAMWFITGVVMMYSWYPAITKIQRWARLEPLALQQCRIAPDAALRAAKVSSPSQIFLSSSLGRPIYRIKAQGKWHAVDARNGLLLGALSPQEGARLAQQWMPKSGVARFLGVAGEHDQWVGRPSMDAYRPIHKFVFNDGTEVYVSEGTRGVVQFSSAWQRRLAWTGTLIHLLEPVAVLRSYSTLRWWIITIAAGIGTLVAISGIWIGILRFRRAGYAARGGARSPYRGPWRWHHWGGLTFGLFAFTWVASGFLYMLYPLSDFPTKEQDAVFSGTVEFDRTPSPRGVRGLDAKRVVREVELIHFNGVPHWVFFSNWNASQTARADGNGVAFAHFDQSVLLAAARKAMPDAPLTDAQMLSQDDAYFYSRQDFRLRRMPVLRVRFADAQGLWFYVDPHTARIEYAITQSDRGYRWLFRSLHSFDFPHFINWRPGWDIAMLLASLGGLALTGSGLIIGFKRLREIWAARARRQTNRAKDPQSTVEIDRTPGKT